MNIPVLRERERTTDRATLNVIVLYPSKAVDDQMLRQWQSSPRLGEQ